MSISVCVGCKSKCAVCGSSGATHGGVLACKNCRKSMDLGMKCAVCGKTRHESTGANLCSKCKSKHVINRCDFCGAKAY